MMWSENLPGKTIIWSKARDPLINTIIEFTNENPDEINTSYEFEIEPLETDIYYGFEITDNRRFLLGDLTVSHNTVMGLYIAYKLNLKTLVLVHKDFLGNQWKERIED